ncbi:hypothetical protein [Flavobacterium sp.]|jgi:hypothetical protein|uniref:hypothetical protein n=1 Tax=Flavobacterium sp. TaxID=239 RepID=UPI002613F994|nr:hypothetical protein [Flavobacterium sp.]
MKTKAKKIEKEFDTVKFFRAVKEKIAEETNGMSFKEFKEYLSKRKLNTTK